MAKPEELDLANGGEKSGGAKKIILIVVIALVGLLAVAGTMVGTLWALGLLPSEESAVQEVEGTETEGEQVQQTTKKPAVYMQIDPPFVVNFDGQGKARFLQVVVEVMGRDESKMEDALHHMPAIRNKLLLLFSAQSYEVLSTVEGKELLRGQALAEMQTVLTAEMDESPIEDLYFTSLVMQ